MMESKNENKEMRVLKIQINKNNKYFKILDNMSLKSKNLYNTAMYYIKNHYIATKNIHDGKENHENAINIMNDIHNWVEEYNYNAHQKNLEIMEYIKEEYNIDIIDLVFGNSDYNKYIKGYKNKLEDKDIKLKKGDKLRNLCFPQNKWYGEFIDSNILNKYLKESEEYRSMSGDCSNIMIRSMDALWKSYFNGLSEYKRNPSKYTGRPNMPRYKPRGDIGRVNFSCRRCYTIEEIKNDDKYYILKLDKSDFKDSGIEFKIPLKNKLDINKKYPIDQVRVIPNKDKYVTSYCVEIVYDIGKSDIKIENDNIVAIDVGVNRLATVCNNIGVKPFAINGLPLKSMNKQWNKDSAKYKSVLKTTNNKNWSNKLELITNHRNNYINTYMHKASTMVVRWCLEYNISKVIIGKNKGWKQECDMGKETQTFVQIPFARFIEMLEYKCKENGITVIIQEESYTSKASFIDNEYIATYGADDIKYKKRRHLRGLYTSDKGIKIHSDLNGAYNILRKYNNNFTYDNNFLHPYILNVG